MTDRLRAAIGGALLFVAAAAFAQNDTTVNAIVQTRDGYLWLGTPKGLDRYNGWDFVHTTVGDSPVNAVAEDAMGTLWIGTVSNGLFLRRNGVVGPVAGSHREIHAIAEDRMHTMWVASDDGVVRYDEANARPLATGPGAPKDPVHAIAVIGDDVWLGSDDGLVRYANGQFMTMWDASVTALAADRDGKLWIGSEHGGVDVFANGEFTKPAAAAPLALTTVPALAASRDGSIWISAEGRGLCRLSTARLDCAAVDNFVRAIHEDREGTIWLGTTNNGLRHLPAGVFVMPAEESSPRVTLRATDGTEWTGTPAGLTHDGQTFTVYDGLASTWVRALAEDRDGSIWIGTSAGLSRYASGKFTTLPSDGELDVRALAVDKNGKLWIGTTAGLRCIDNARVIRCGEGRAIFAFDIAPDGTVLIPPIGLGAVYGAVRDARGTPWYATSKGIVHGATLVDAIPIDDHVQPAATRSDDGTLSFHTTRGLVLIDPVRAARNDAPPPVAIENVAVHEDRAEFRYIGLSFVDPQKVLYRTKLEGFDRSWSDARSDRSASYADLPPGNYVFRVIAANNDGVWNRAGASVPLRIAPPFWQTWWFALLLLAAVGVVGLIAYFVHRENTRLAQLATVDPLTRLANRRTLDAALRRKWGAVVLCDIDHFKIYNDTFGHQAGDETLARVAQAIAASVDPASGLAARYGGEEFIVLLAHAEDAPTVAATIVDAVRTLRIPHRDGIVTVSAGVSTAAAGDMIRAADEALYRAKSDGRNRFVVAEVPDGRELE